MLPEFNIWVIEQNIIDEHAWVQFLRDNLAHTSETVRADVKYAGIQEGLQRAWDFIQINKDLS